MEEPPAYCSFCGKTGDQVERGKLVTNSDHSAMICNPCADLVRLVTMDDEDFDAWKAREDAPHFEVITARFRDTDTAIVVEPGTDHEKAVEEHRQWAIRKGILPDEERLVAREFNRTSRRRSGRLGHSSTRAVAAVARPSSPRCQGVRTQ